MGGIGRVGAVAGTQGDLGDLGEKTLMYFTQDIARRRQLSYIIAVCMKVGAVGFSDTFFDHSYIFAFNLPDIEHLNGPHKFLRRYACVGPYFPTTLSFSRNSDF